MGHLDVALTFIKVPLVDSPIEFRHWMTDTYLLAIHEASPVTKKPPKKLANLGNADFIFMRFDQSPFIYDLMIPPISTCLTPTLETASVN